MGTEVVDLENFFIGKPDRCERLISCLQYCLESDSANIRNGDHLYAVRIDMKSVPSYGFI